MLLLVIIMSCLLILVDTICRAKSFILLITFERVQIDFHLVGMCVQGMLLVDQDVDMEHLFLLPVSDEVIGI